MSIAQYESELLDYVEQNIGAVGITFSKDDQVRRVLGACKFLWTGLPVELKNYTDHGLRHSAAIVQRLSKLAGLYRTPCTNYEKLLFVTAALIHDVGMQYNAWAGLRTVHGDGTKVWEVLGTPQPPLPDDTVRASHANLGAALCFPSKAHSELIPEMQFCVDSEASKNTLYYASLVAFAHQAESDWYRRLQTGDNQYADKGYEEPFSPAKLAGLFRLCDELDGTTFRISAPARMFAEDVELESMRHWLSCYFVVNTVTTLCPENGLLEIELVWRLPVNASEEFRANVEELLRTMRLRKINDTCEDINNVFGLAEHKKWKFSWSVRDLDDPISENLDAEQPLQDSVAAAVQVERAAIADARSRLTQSENSAELVNESVAPTQPAPDGAEECEPMILPARSKHAEAVGEYESILADSLGDIEDVPEAVPDSDDGTAVAASTQEPSMGAADAKTSLLEQMLRTWYKQHVVYRHVELASLMHTSQYLHCRKLVSDQSLTMAVVEEIVSRLSGHRVSLVVGVGTSAISLAVNVALRLGAAVSFTFNVPETAKKISNSQQLAREQMPETGRPLRKRHYDVEVTPVLACWRADTKILILDDVIAAGKVARQVCERLINASDGLKVTANDLIYVAIYRLGVLDINGFPGVPVDYLCHVENVYYADGRNDCVDCLRGDPPVREIDLP